MSLDSTHPLYDEFADDWRTQRDLYRGERVVKSRGETYLPATAGMRLDGMLAKQPGRAAYDAYKLRAVFPDYIKDGVEALIGLLHQKEAAIELPAVMEPLRERATVNGESLNMLLRRINEEQLVTGRLGLLLDLPVNPDPAAPLPYVATYIAEAIRNWDDGNQQIEGFNNLNLVVLDESGPIRNNEFVWDTQTKYRVLMVGKLQENETEGTYTMGTFANDGSGAASFNATAMLPPMIRGQVLNEIPFVFVNTKDIISTPDDPPLLGLGRLALAIYRGEADYRQCLFMQGQDTLVVVGGIRNPDGAAGEDDAIRTGAGSRIDVEQGGDAKYIGVSANGLSEQRQALENDRKRAETKSGQLISAKGSQQESGEALKTRLAAQTATLNQIALAGAAGLENVLRIAAKWLGANPDEVSVTPNLEFSDFNLSGQEIVYLMTARTMGAPLSKESIHSLMVDRGITKLDYETEIDKIGEEDANSPTLGTGAGGAPDPDPNNPGDGGAGQ